jgi:enoyl-CoA hydratase/carnithine racemase
MLDFTTIQYTVNDGIAEILLDRPDKLNALSKQLITEFGDALSAAQNDDRVYAIIISGNGRGFCSGADISDLSHDDEDQAMLDNERWKRTTIQDGIREIYYGDKPTIAAVNGPTVGAGCGIALASDLRVMAEGAFLRESFTSIGLVPADGDGWFLKELIGESKAREFLLTSKDITPTDAEDLGLVVEICEDDEVMESARELARDIRDKPAMAIRETKSLITEADSLDQYLRESRNAQKRVRSDSEHIEAIQAYGDDRNPEFQREY